MKNFTSAITYSSPDGLIPVFPFPHPQRVYGRTEYARLLNFLTHGAPLRALRARELRHYTYEEKIFLVTFYQVPIKLWHLGLQ